MEKINENARIIAKSGDIYVVVNSDETNKLEYDTLGKIINNQGIQESDWLPLGTIMRDSEDWELVDIPYNKMLKKNDTKAIDGLLGFAVGDALGVPVEFMDRESVRKVNLKDMIGKDTGINFKSRWGNIIPSGSWSDDTSMLIAGMDSLADNEAEANYDDIMRRYIQWWNEGKYTSLDTPFGLGGCVAKSFEKYFKGAPALESGANGIRDNGNGSLMRIFPFSYYCIENDLSEKETCEYISKASMITHAHPISQLGCFIYTEFLKKIVETKNPRLAYGYISSIDYLQYFDRETVLAYKQLLNPSFSRISDDSIKASGYVVDTLESAIYSVLHGNGYEDTVLTAINMGYDTDTVAGITGSIAGMLYGKEDIPQRWLDKLRKKDYLEELGAKFEQTIEDNKLEKKNNFKLR